MSGELSGTYGRFWAPTELSTLSKSLKVSNCAFIKLFNKGQHVNKMIVQGLQVLVSLVPSLVSLGLLAQLRIYGSKTPAPTGAIGLIAKITLLTTLLNVCLLEEELLVAVMKSVGLPLKVFCMVAPAWSTAQQNRNEKLIEVACFIVVADLLYRLALPKEAGKYLSLLLPGTNDLLGVMLWAVIVGSMIVLYTTYARKIRRRKK